MSLNIGEKTQRTFSLNYYKLYICYIHIVKCYITHHSISLRFEKYMATLFTDPYDSWIVPIYEQ